MKVYGVDLDGVTFDFKRGLGLHIEDKLGIPYVEKDIISYFWHECVDGLEEDKFFELFHEFGRGGGYRDLDALPGAIEGIKELIKNGHEVRFITSRPLYAYRDTVECLVEHGLDKGIHLHFAEGPKSTYIKKYSIDVFIDDSPDTITELVANTRAQIYCMDHGFNHHLDDNDGKWFKRVHGWDEFLEAEGIYANNKRC